MDILARLAIRKQLHWLLLLVIAVLFCVATTWFSFEERRAYHQRAGQELALVAEVVTVSIAPAVLYGAEHSAEETLAALGQNPGIELAAVVDSSGEVFVQYVAPHADHRSLQLPQELNADGAASNHHEMRFPIYLDNGTQAVGELYIRAELVGLQAHMLRYYINQGLVLLAVMLVAYLFGVKIQRAIAAPYQEQNRNLEEKVARRTALLEEINHQMAQEIEERKVIEADLNQRQEEQAKLITKLEEAHNQLLQSEKMASIGQLAAGVAHEINNPVGFINSNLSTLQQYFQDLLKVLEAYGQTESALADQPEILAAIDEAKRQADLDYLSEDIADLLKESREGVDRVKKIVQDLKDFSRADQGQREWADLHQGLESTLNVAWNELKYKCQVVKEYDTDLPLVNCRLSQLNQVFMNLLVNAAQAIDEQGTVTIRTGHDDASIWVEVQDTGRGIPADNLKHIFDPFFTTKPVGKGTGLGLSISYGIIQKHGGEIKVQSQVGEGTLFRVLLPLDSESLPDALEPVSAVSS